MTNSGDSPRSKLATVAVAGALALLVAAAAAWCYRNGCILYYGDAESHLDISRGLVDSRTPGYTQLGTVWLPLLHLICAPFVRNRELWMNGLAGTIPVALCFVLAGTCLFAAAREAYQSLLPALVVVACFVLNPNALYLAAIPMTEIVFLSGLAVIMLAVLRFERTQHKGWIALAIFTSWCISLTRYDGWFLIPFIGLWLMLAARRNRFWIGAFFVAAASLACLYWFAHNWYETGNALDFYNGPYSARAIQHGESYPGYRDWIAALHYYGTACVLCAGVPLMLLGLAGLWFAYRRRALLPALFLALPPIFYLWSMHSTGGTPIFVPSLWPFSYYNTRYGIAAVPLCAMAAGALAGGLSGRARWLTICIPLLAISPWLLHPGREHWICWKESQVNSVDRRAWTELGAHYLLQHRTPGACILASAGDVTGIFRIAGIPLRDTINIGNGPLWFAATKRPDLFHPCAWAAMQQRDALSRSLARGPYHEVLSISTSEFSPDLIIARRDTP